MKTDWEDHKRLVDIKFAATVAALFSVFALFVSLMCLGHVLEIKHRLPPAQSAKE